MSSRFDYLEFDSLSDHNQQEAKTLCLFLEAFIEKTLDAGRSRSIALTKLEELYMWIGRSIRNDQITRTTACE